MLAWSAWDEADFLGSAVCHRLIIHSYVFDERALPLCARCSGTYLGALVTIFGLGCMGRRTWTALPPVRILFLMIGYVAIMGVDGVNSFLSLYPGAPLAYEPLNILRLTTGTLTGVTVGVVTFAIFNNVVWKDGTTRPVVSHWLEVAGITLAALLATSVVALGGPELGAAFALAEGASIVVVFTMLNAVLGAILLRREALATSWGEAAPLLTLGLVVGLLELGGIAAFRALAFPLLGLPL